MEGMVGRMEPTFASKFPTCLHATDYYTDPSEEEALANLEFLTREGLTVTAGTVKPVDESADSADDAFELGTDTPLHVNRYGNLCTSSIMHRDSESSAFLRQIQDAIFDTSITIDSETDESEYPDNVLNAMLYLSEDLFDSIVTN
jgi:hypothetical protein